MKMQFKYAFYHQRTLRVGIILPLLIINIIAFLINVFMINKYHSIDFYNYIMAIYYVSFGGILALSLAADLIMINNIYKAPYLELMLPTAGWKRLLAKIGIAFISDIICIAIFLMQFLWQMENMFKYRDQIWWVFNEEILEKGTYSVIGATLNYTMGLMLIILMVILSKSIFAGVKGGEAWSIGTVILISWIFNLLNILLIPFQKAEANTGLFTLNIELSNNSLLFMYWLFIVIKIIILFLGSSYLLERKINL